MIARLWEGGVCEFSQTGAAVGKIAEVRWGAQCSRVSLFALPLVVNPRQARLALDCGTQKGPRPARGENAAFW